ncbi:WXG100 family type VII secretion target [Streptomyces fuscigenes]|uniref:WXG100 family type VII secretion target n=1 Tax=Streptomyces fuscigenes TaxID=1528880 RepID=UPI001F39E4E7|nr:WXG100 family type VII secretion target [Streptomyces fuscigenes]MCF3964935.1 WXG100 family type VII secretion target [Streptomyces fuscigenes]
MTTYTVQMEQVDYIVGEMQAITQKIQGTLQNLDDASKMNLAEWTSDAQQTYYEVKAKWDSAAADMQNMATQATQMLGNINQAYSDGERQGVNLWQG